MAYSAKIEKIFKSKGINVGDFIRIVKGDQIFEGILMPRVEFGERDVIIIKLKNGYNIGIKFDENTKIEKLGKGRKPGKIPALKIKGKGPPICFIATGGTIATHVDYLTGGVYMCRKPEEILVTTPELSEIVEIKSMLNPFTLASEDLTPREWIKLAKIVAKELNKEIFGAIITHGTDTMHFTAAALSFMLKNLTKPVALVGAQRSPDRGSFDGRLNLICAAHYAKSEIAEVSIVMHASTNDDFCFALRGTKVRKMHTSRRDAFKPVNDKPLAKIWPNGKIEIVNENFRKRKEGKVKADARFEEKVALIKVYPGSDPSIMDWFIQNKYKGIVIEGTGLGHVPTNPLWKDKSWIPFIKKAIDSNIIVCITSQCLFGRTHPYVYRNLRILNLLGVIFCEDMLPEVAYVKLGWVLAHTNKYEKVKEMMLTSYAGEISACLI